MPTKKLKYQNQNPQPKNVTNSYAAEKESSKEAVREALVPAWELNKHSKNDEAEYQKYLEHEKKDQRENIKHVGAFFNYLQDQNVALLGYINRIINEDNDLADLDKIIVNASNKQKTTLLQNRDIIVDAIFLNEVNINLMLFNTSENLKEYYLENDNQKEMLNQFINEEGMQDMLSQWDDLLLKCQEVLTKRFNIFCNNSLNSLIETSHKLEVGIKKNADKIAKLDKQPWWRAAFNKILRFVTFNCASKNKFPNRKQLQQQKQADEQKLIKVNCSIKQLSETKNVWDFQKKVNSSKSIPDFSVDLFKNRKHKKPSNLSSFELLKTKTLQQNLALSKKIPQLNIAFNKKYHNCAEFNNDIKISANNSLLPSYKFSSNAMVN